MRLNLTLFLLLIAATVAKAQAPVYNHYYGNLHAHSSYSDGNADAATSGHTTPFQNYVYANGSLHFDFLGISEHNHSGAGMQKVNYKKGLRQADSATVNGQFVALYGMEWGEISTGGHVLVYGVDSLIGWEPNNHDIFVAQNDYQGLFRQINKRPGAFATLAHPNSTDFGNLIGSSTSFRPGADSAIVGTVMRSGPAFSTNVTYSNPSTSSYESYYRIMLAKGYHVGISLDHDNHNTTFGRHTGARVVALAPSLTKADIMDAFRQRRFYASDDWNAQVDFTLNNQPMGSIVYAPASSGAHIRLDISDGDNELAQSYTLMKGIPGSGQQAVVFNQSTHTPVATLIHSDFTNTGPVYYYFIVIQQDGDRIVTSPIWFNPSSATGVEEEPIQLALNVYPNPVSTGPVTISYYLDKQEVVTIEIFDALGRVVKVVADNQTQGPGSYSYSLVPEDMKADNGVYTIRFIHNGAVSYRKLIIMN